ncbi:MAG TPA: tetratricopeptide repeat protein [Polyangia bacterium]|nr:tetratricopeptide repeat protein [Polyangia bacterium]
MRSVLAFLLLIGSVRIATAQDDKTERARIHLKAAIAYYDEARYEDAAREMEAASQLKPLPDLQYNLAQCYERLGRYSDAAKAYETYLAGNAAAPDRKLVETRVANLRERAAATTAGSQVAPLPPEKVVFKTIVVYKTPPPPPGRGVRYAAYGLGALALGAAASGIAFAVLAKQDADAVSKGGSTSAPPTFDVQSATQKAGQTDVIISGVSFGVAALCAGGAIGLYLLGNKIDKEAPKLTMAPTLSPSGGGLVLAGRF